MRITTKSRAANAALDWRSIKSAVTARCLALYKNGRLLWQKQIQSPFKRDDYSSGMVLDRQGNPVLTGFAIRPSGKVAGITIKLRGGDGALMWREVYQQSPESLFYDIGVDAQGSVFVCGMITTKSTSTAGGALSKSVPLKYVMQP